MGLIVIVLLGVVVVVGVALLLSLHEGGLRDASVDHGDLGLPDRALTADDIASLRFRTGLRGYRMEDVDAALERVAQALQAAQPPRPDRPEQPTAVLQPPQPPTMVITEPDPPTESLDGPESEA